MYERPIRPDTLLLNSIVEPLGPWTYIVWIILYKVFDLKSAIVFYRRK